MICCAAECPLDCPGPANQWRDASTALNSSYDARVKVRTSGGRLQDGVSSKSASAEGAVNGSLQRQKSVQNSGDPQARLSVPKRRDGALLCATFQDAFDLLTEARGIAAHQDVGSDFDGAGAFGVLPHGQAGNLQVSGLLLDASGSGDDHRGVLLEPEKLEIAEGIGQEEVAADRGQVVLLEPASGARMDGKDHL